MADEVLKVAEINIQNMVQYGYRFRDDGDNHALVQTHQRLKLEQNTLMQLQTAELEDDHIDMDFLVSKKQ
jgi:hypothetical protein